VGFVFLWFFIGGIAHFVATETEMRIVPPWVPWPRAAVLVSGVFELLGAVGLLWRPTRRAAGIGLFLLAIAVTPCHIYMLQRTELFPVPIWALWLRPAGPGGAAGAHRVVHGPRTVGLPTGLSYYRPV